MIDTLLYLKLIKEYEGTYVLTRLGQTAYGGTDPRSWVEVRENQNMSFSELCQECDRLFGVEPTVSATSK